MTRNGLYGFAVTGVLAGATAALAAVYIGSANQCWVALGRESAHSSALAGSGNLKVDYSAAWPLGLLKRWSLDICLDVDGGIVYGAVMLLIIAKPQGLFGARV